MMMTELLGLSPSSPDAAIFKNASKLSPPSTPSASADQTSTPPTPSDSYMVRPLMMTEVIVMTLAILAVAVPTGFISIYT